MQLIGIGTELTCGIVVAINNKTVHVERDGCTTSLTLKEAENAVRPVSKTE